MTTTTVSPTIAALRAAEQRYDDGWADAMDTYWADITYLKTQAANGALLRDAWPTVHDVWRQLAARQRVWHGDGRDLQRISLNTAETPDPGEWPELADMLAGAPERLAAKPNAAPDNPAELQRRVDELRQRTGWTPSRSEAQKRRDLLAQPVAVIPEPGPAGRAFLAQGPNDDDMPGVVTGHLAYDPDGLQPPTRGPLRRAWNRATNAIARLGAGQEQ